MHPSLRVATAFGLALALSLALGPVAHADLVPVDNRTGVVTASDLWILTAKSSAEVDVGVGTVQVTVRSLRHARAAAAPRTTLTLKGNDLTPGGSYMLIVSGTPVVNFTADPTGRALERLTSGEAPEGWSPLLPAVVETLTAPLAAVQVVAVGSPDVGSGFLAPDARSGRGAGDGGHSGWTPLCSADGAAFGGVLVLRDGDLQYLAVIGEGLESVTNHGVVVDGVLLGHVATDEFGLLWADATNDPSFPATFELPETVLPVEEIDTVQITLDGGVVLAGSFSDPCQPEPPMPDEWGTIQLCNDDNPAVMGWFDWIVFSDGPQAASITAFGVEPGAVVSLTLDGVEAGEGVVDQGGVLWIALSTEPGPGELPLPEEVLPLSAVEKVTLWLGDVAVLAGSSDGTCGDNVPPEPVDMDATPLCSDDGSGAFGEAGWLVYDNGDEELWISAMGLTPGQQLGLIVDGHDLGTFVVDDWGGLMVGFSSDPVHPDALPLPGSVRPVSAIDEVILAAGGGYALVGSFSDPCDGDVEPPQPVDMDVTPLCAASDAGPSGGAAASGEAAWLVYDTGAEELWVSAMGLMPGEQLELLVDGTSLGTFTVDDWGDLFLGFASDSTYPGVLPLPDAVRPVSEIDEVILAAGGGYVLAGSFSDPCDDWVEPPQPVESAWTPLCGDSATQARGDAMWAVYDNGAEELWVSAMGLAPGLELELLVDGHSLGTFTTDDWGDLILGFASDSTHPDLLPLPDAVRPVSEIDQVAFVNSDGVLLQGSFSEPCEGGGPGNGSGDTTTLCGPDGEVLGVASWWQMAMGDATAEEAIEVFGWTTDPFSAYDVVIDGIHAGRVESDPGGMWMLLLCTSGCEPIPPELSPVSDIDHVVVLDSAGEAVMEGRFSAPCAESGDGGPWPGGGNAALHTRQ